MVNWYEFKKAAMLRKVLSAFDFFVTTRNKECKPVTVDIRRIGAIYLLIVFGYYNTNYSYRWAARAIQKA